MASQVVRLEDVVDVKPPETTVSIDDVVSVQPAQPPIPSMPLAVSHTLPASLAPLAPMPSHAPAPIVPADEQGILGPVRVGAREALRSFVGAPAEALAATGVALGVLPDSVRANVARANESLSSPVNQLPVFDVKTWTDPRWLASVAGQSLGSIASLMTAGGLTRMAITKAGPALKLAPRALALLEQHGALAGAAVAESWLESGLGYSEARDKGATPEEAAKAAALQFAMNIPITLAGNLPVFEAVTGRKALDVLIAALSEGAQEVAQQGAGNVAAKATYDPGRPVMEGAAQAGVIGALAGGVAHVGLGALSATPEPAGVPFQTRPEPPPAAASLPQAQTEAPPEATAPPQPPIAPPGEPPPAKPTAPADRAAYISEKEYRQRLGATYATDENGRRRSSRTNPQTAPIPPVGSWMIDDTRAAADGHEIQQLIEVPVESLAISEDTGPGKFGDVEQYARWTQEGREAPPITVVQTDKGVLKTLDHRRLLAAKALGQKTIKAWVSWSTASPRPGNPITGLTYELAQQGAQPLPVVPAAPGDRIFVDDEKRLEQVKANLAQPPVAPPTVDTGAPITVKPEQIAAVQPPQQAAPAPAAPQPSQAPAGEDVEFEPPSPPPAPETPERRATINAILAAARKPEPTIVPIRETKGTDGKWYRSAANSMPIGVKPTDEHRTNGYAIQTRDGTTVGTRGQTAEEVLAHWREGQARDEADFRQALEQADEKRLASQAEYWLKNREAATESGLDVLRKALPSLGYTASDDASEIHDALLRRAQRLTKGKVSKAEMRAIAQGWVEWKRQTYDPKKGYPSTADTRKAEAELRRIIMRAVDQTRGVTAPPVPAKPPEVKRPATAGAAVESRILPARYVDIYERLRADAVANGYTGPEEELRAKFILAAAEAEHIAQSVAPDDSEGHADTDLLKAISAAGGLGINAEGGTADGSHRAGMSGELETMLESLNGRKATAVVKRGKRAGQVQKLPPARTGGVPGIPGIIVRDGGLSLDYMREHLNQDPRFQGRFDNLADFLEAVDNAIRVVTGTAQAAQTPTSDPIQILGSLLGVRKGEKWWTEADQVDTPPDEGDVDFNFGANAGEPLQERYDTRQTWPTYQAAADAAMAARKTGRMVRVSSRTVSGGPKAFGLEEHAGGRWVPLGADPAITSRPQGDLFGGPTSDLLSTGEEQPRLPGDVGRVRDTEIAQPQVAEIPEKPFELTNEVAVRKTKQETLFEGEHLGSPTRRLYAPTMQTARPWRGGRAISEPDTVQRLQGIFAVERVTDSWLKHLLGQAKALYPVRFGKRGVGRAFGNYTPDTGLIRLKRAFDLTTFTHELGHMLSFRFFAKDRPVGLFNGEILRMGKKRAPGGADLKLVFEEGVAEYFRVWFANETEAARQAPAFTDALNRWMDEHPVPAAQLLAGRDVVQRYLSQPAAVRGRARLDIKPAGLRERATDVVGELQAGDRGLPFHRRLWSALVETGNMPAILRDKHRWFNNMMKLWIDGTRAIQLAAADAEAKIGRKTDPALDAWVLARIAAGSSGRAEAFLKHGPRGRDGKTLGPGLEEALRPVHDRIYPDKERARPDLSSYLYALRAVELLTDGKGRSPGMTAEEAKEIITQTHADRDAQKFKTAAKKVHAYLRGLRQYQLQYGTISPELNARLEDSMFYVPLQRIMEDAKASLMSGGGAAALANRGNQVKRLKGSGRKVVDLYESIVRNTEAIVNATENNRAAQALVKAMDTAPESADWLVEIPQEKVAAQFNLQQLSKEILEKLKQAGVDLTGSTLEPGVMSTGQDPFDELVTVFLPAAFGDPRQQIVTVLLGGQRRWFQVQDRALYEAITAIGIKPTSVITRFAAKPTAMLRAGATLRPSFIIGNLWRDTIGAMMQSRHGFIPIYDNIRGILGQIKGDEDLRLFEAHGVQASTLLGQDRDRIRELIDRIKTPPTFAGKVKLALHPLQLLRYLSEQIEVSSRLGEFKLALDNAGGDRRVGVLGIGQRLLAAAGPNRARPPITESRLVRATLAARDVTIDFSRGGTISKELSSYKAFFNARLQGYVRIAETIRRDPSGAAVTIGLLSALSAALWALNKDDPEYQEIPAQQKRDYWFIKLPGADWFISIPKPFEWALVPNVTEAALDDTQDAMKVLGWGQAPQGYLEELVLQLTPTGLLPFLEVIANYDSYRQRPIVNPFDTEKAPDLQVREWTSETARAIAEPLGVSPANLEHLAYGFGGGLARDFAALSDKAIDAVGARSGRPARASRPWYAETPGLARMMRPSAMGSTSQSIQDFYDASTRYQGDLASLRERQKGKGRRVYVVEARKFQEKYPPEVQARLRAARSAIDELREKLSAVAGSGTMSADAKAKAQAALYERMADIARRGLGRPGIPPNRLSQRETLAGAPK